MIYSRNSDRTKMKWDRSLNCGSYALDVDSWFHPYSNWDESEDRDLSEVWTYDDRAGDVEYYYQEEDWSLCDIYEYVLEKDIEEILLQCPWVRQCKPSECNDGRRMIAYRIGIKEDDLQDYGEYVGDFHFRLREKGVWMEKNGGGPVHKVQDDGDFDDPWFYGEDSCIYDSRIVYFCFREDDDR